MRKKNTHKGTLTIPRCKRIIRPLISKIASLTGLYIKHPFKFDLDIESFDIVQENHGQSVKFINPSTSDDRLLYLKPYLNPEIYQTYVEIFTLFKSIVRAWLETGPPAKTRVPKLSTISSLKVGKMITLGTKSTHYRLNQTALFDAESIPRYLQKYKDELADDIDVWLSMEPQYVMQTHMIDLLYGYVIHLLIFNLRTTLYCLIPVLVHWLQEQDDSHLKSLLRTLLYEFFIFLPIDADQRAVKELTSEVAQHDPSIPIFWLFHGIGYWKRLCFLCKLDSINVSAKLYEPYDSLFIDVLAKTDRLFLTDVIDLPHIYSTLQRNPQHPHNTSLMMSILAQIISLFKKTLDSSRTSTTALRTLQAGINDFTEFVRTWLSLSSDCVFNSLDGGNEETFEALINVLKFMRRHCDGAISYIEDSLLRNRIIKLEDVLSKFKQANSSISDFFFNIRVLQAYYLDNPDLCDLEGVKLPSASHSLAYLMAHNCEFDEVVNLLAWIRDLPNEKGLRMSKLLFREFFKENLVLGEMDVEHVAWELYDL